MWTSLKWLPSSEDNDKNVIKWKKIVCNFINGVRDEWRKLKLMTVVLKVKQKNENKINLA